MIIQTERLELIPLTFNQLKLWIEDIPALEKELSCSYRAELMEGFFLEIVKGQYEITQKDPNNYLWHSFFFLIRKEDRVVVGSADFKDIPNENGEIEIGYGLGKEFEHNGYMTEAAKAMCKWALKQNGVTSVTAETDLEGFASQNILKRCGFKKDKEEETVWWRLYKEDMKMKIETNDLIIRKFELSDENDLCEYMMQRVNAEFEGYPDFTCQKAKKEIEFRSQSDEFYAIELKKEHKVIGNIYLGKRDFNTRELGYVLNENYQYKGYGTDASKAAIEYMFNEGVHRIYAECAPQNTPSWKLMEKVGMKREAYFRKNVSFHNDENGYPIYWDTYVYAILNPQEEV